MLTLDTVMDQLCLTAACASPSPASSRLKQLERREKDQRGEDFEREERSKEGEKREERREGSKFASDAVCA